MQLALGTDAAPAICVDCLTRYGRLEEPLVLEPPEIGKPGCRPPTGAMKRKSRRRENDIAKSIGGRAQPASGALPHAKGDVRKKGKWRVQDKTSRNKSFALTRRIIDEIRSQCTYGEKFAITIGFLNPMTQKGEDDVVVMDRHIWEEMVNAHDDK